MDFTRLPAELRYKIWVAALTPRIVEIHVSNDLDIGFCSRAKLPSILHATRESRQAVSSLYPHCFGSVLMPPRIRFNFEIDTLYLSTHEEANLMQIYTVLKEWELSSLRFFAIDDDYVTFDFRTSEPRLKSMISYMHNLQELKIVNDASSTDESVEDFEAQLQSTLISWDELMSWPALKQYPPGGKDHLENVEPGDKEMYHEYFHLKPGTKVDIVLGCRG